ncbi:hypothetical protein DPMN_039810 [Dreissena polymorpha]|uniref:Uncharacterized protein n=1 Tax=Dreissena polymorpha TaxID=45954 RepID=A0A9D4CWK3_DREPO|nr:hypothetical protein DPMN_039810 [Dreissena polymorpha]
MIIVNDYDLVKGNDDAVAAGSAADDDRTAKMIILQLSNFGPTIYQHSAWRFTIYMPNCNLLAQCVAFHHLHVQL